MSAIARRRSPARRRRTDTIARGLLAAATLVALVPLVLVIYYLLKKGLGALSWSFFTTDPTGSFLGDPGGVKRAILGTLEIVALATADRGPARHRRRALPRRVRPRQPRSPHVVRYFVDVMTGVPSIVFGLFIYITLVVSGVGGGFAGWKGSVALALLMLPVVTRSAEVVLHARAGPPARGRAGARRAALARGHPRSCCRPRCPASSPARCSPSPAARARPRRCCSRSAIVNGTTLEPRASRMNSLPDPDLRRRRPGAGPPRRARVGRGPDARR